MGAPESSPPGGSIGGRGMGVQPGKQGLLQVRVVGAALSCFSRPPSRIRRLVAFEFGDGMAILPGSRVPSLRGYVLSERDRTFLVLVWGKFGNRLIPLFGSHMDRGAVPSAVARPCQAVPGTRLCRVDEQSSEEGCQAQ